MDWNRIRTASPIVDIGRVTSRGLLVGVIALTTAVACGPLATGVATDAPSATARTDAQNPLLGTWAVEISRDDLEAGGITADGLLDENSGRFTWTFNPDGTWRQVQESLDGSAIKNPVFEGTYEVQGATLLQRTTFPAEYEEEGQLEYRWEIGDGGLELELMNPPDPMLPIIVGSHPWARVSS